MLSVLILAAGQGKRMHSSLPKVLHPVLYRPMIHYVVETARSLGANRIGMVVGHGEGEVRKACSSYSEVVFFSQKEQKGTGHAVSMASEFLSESSGTCLVLYGDVILLKRETLLALLEKHESQKATATVLTANLRDPSGYGRVLRDGKGGVVGIKEHVDCSEKERAISEVNSGIYCFSSKQLLEALRKLSTHNRQGELYLTDTIEIFHRQGEPCAAQLLQDNSEILGINDRNDLAHVETAMRSVVNTAFMKKGITMQVPESITIDPGCDLSEDITIEAGCTLVQTSIGKGTRLESGSRIFGSKIGSGSHIKQGSYIENSLIGNETTVGPYAHLRPETHLGNNVKIGNFVEVKKSVMKDGSKASHLSYIGDAEVGENSNLGCGFITCNYDGKKKSKTTIG